MYGPYSRRRWYGFIFPLLESMLSLVELKPGPVLSLPQPPPLILHSINQLSIGTNSILSLNTRHVLIFFSALNVTSCDLDRRLTNGIWRCQTQDFANLKLLGQVTPACWLPQIQMQIWPEKRNDSRLARAFNDLNFKCELKALVKVKMPSAKEMRRRAEDGRNSRQSEIKCQVPLSSQSGLDCNFCRN